MLKPIATIQKKDRFELGYKPDRLERQRFIEEKIQRRIVSFFRKKRERAQEWRYHR